MVLLLRETFPGTSPPAGWTRRNIVSGDETWLSPGVTVANLNPGDFYLKDLPTGLDTTDLIVELQFTGKTTASCMIGPALLSATGFGAMASSYDAPTGILALRVSPGYSYDSGFQTVASSPNLTSGRVRLRKNGNNYYSSYSTDGGATWSSESPVLNPSGGPYTITQMAIGDIVGSGKSITITEFTLSDPFDPLMGRSHMDADGDVVPFVPDNLASGISHIEASPTSQVSGVSTPSGVSNISASGGSVYSAGNTSEMSGLSHAEASRVVAPAVLPAREIDAPVEPGVHFPTGDNYNDPIVISGSNGTLPIDFAGATTEVGEDLPVDVDRTIWLRWDTGEEENPRVVFDTPLSHIAIGTGVDADSFVPIWSGLGGVAAYPDPLVSYMVQLGWHAIDPEEVVVEWASEEPPSYDEFSTPLEMSGNLDRANLSTDFCTVQASEPLPVGAETTAWTRWTPDTAGQAILTTSDPTLIIRVYEDGNVISSLVLVEEGTGSVTFAADAVPYLVQICDTTEPGA